MEALDIELGLDEAPDPPLSPGLALQGLGLGVGYDIRQIRWLGLGQTALLLTS